MDFMIIGAQKAGTTWLYKRLCELDDFDMPPIKELHYFDRSSKYLSTSLLNKNNVIEKLRDKYWLKNMFKNLSNTALRKDLHNFRWCLKYYFSSPYHDDWYCSLSDQRNGLFGDCTPAYSILEKSEIKQIYKLLPDVKILFMIRNPIDRIWSSYKYYKRDKGTKNINQEEVLQFAKWQGQELRSDYLKTLELYSSVFPPQQILIGFYDAIIDQPLDLITNVVKFFGGESSHIERQCNLNELNNVSLKLELQDKLRRQLELKYQGMISEMIDGFGGYCNNWIGEKKSEKYPSVLSLKKDTY